MSQPKSLLFPSKHSSKNTRGMTPRQIVDPQEIVDSQGLIDPRTEIGYYWTAIALFPFPRRALPETDRIKKTASQNKGMSFEIISTDGKGGIPFGVHSRKILLWLTTSLKKKLPPNIDTSKLSTADRRILLPASPVDFYREVTGDYDTRSDNLHRQMADFRAQLRRIINTMFSIGGINHSLPDGTMRDRLVRIQIVEAYDYLWLSEDYRGQAGISVKDFNKGGFIQLSELFIDATIYAQKVFPTNVIPLKSKGITAMHFDIFVFLSYRLGVTALTKNEKNRLVSWEFILANFYETAAPTVGSGRARKNKFKTVVYTCLERLKAAGFMTDVDVHFDKHGLTLWGTPLIPLKKSQKPRLEVL